MSQASTIGLDIAKQVFQAHGADALGGWCCARDWCEPGCSVLRRATAVCGGAGGMWRGAPLGAGIGRLGRDGAADPAGLREAVREAAEERCGGCRGDLRGRAATEHALRAGEERGAAGEGRWCFAPATCWSGSGRRHQRTPRTSGRVRQVAPQGRHVDSLVAPGRGPSGLRAGGRARDPAGTARSLTAGPQIEELEVRSPARRGRPGRAPADDDPGHRPDRGDSDHRAAPAPETFRAGRDFAAWLGLTPQQKSTGGKQKLGAHLEDGRADPAAPADPGGSAVVPGRASAARRRARGSRRCSRASRACWSPWRWPTRRPASSGPCWSRTAVQGSGRGGLTATATRSSGKRRRRDGATVGKTGSENQVHIVTSSTRVIWIRSANSHTGPQSIAAQEAGQMAASDYASRHS